MEWKDERESWDDYVQRVVAPALELAAKAASAQSHPDPPAAIAEAMRSNAAADAQRRDRLELEEAELDEQLIRAYAELHAHTRKERQQSQPDAAAYALWHEARRLKRVTRGIKQRLELPLATSDFVMPSGVVVLCGGPGVDADSLCRQLQAHCGFAYVTDATAANGALERAPSVVLWMEAEMLLASPAAVLNGFSATPRALLLVYTSAEGCVWAEKVQLAVETEWRPRGVSLRAVRVSNHPPSQLHSLICSLEER